MLAQTNLQLYRQLAEAGWSDESLAMIRAAYDLARELFVGCYRPSQKCFSAHLIGVASALGAWGEPREMVVAGMLHSAYLFGEFGDGTRGMTDRKRRLLEQRVGRAAESLVARYTNGDSSMLERGAASGDRELGLLLLADLYDECVDAGPRYAPRKRLPLGLPENTAARPVLIQVAGELAGTLAADDFRAVFQQFDSIRPAAALVADDQAFHTVPSAARHGWIHELWGALRKRAA